VCSSDLIAVGYLVNGRSGVGFSCEISDAFRHGEGVRLCASDRLEDPFERGERARAHVERGSQIRQGGEGGESVIEDDQIRLRIESSRHLLSLPEWEHLG